MSGYHPYDPPTTHPGQQAPQPASAPQPGPAGQYGAVPEYGQAQAPGYIPTPEYGQAGQYESVGQMPVYPPMLYPQMMVRPEHPQATTVLVLGILGFVTSGLTGPFAWAIGNKALKECDSGMYRVTDQLTVGRILGIVTSILLIVGVAVTIFILFAVGIFAGMVFR